MTNSSPKTDVRQLLTEDIDAQIAELRAKKKRLADAGRALVAAADEVDARKAAVGEAEKAFAHRRQELVELGMKPRAISRLLRELRATPDGEGPDNHGETSAPSETRTPAMEAVSADSGPGHEYQQTSAVQ